MTNDTINPPPELVRQWMHESNHNDPIIPQVAAFAAQWGADQELEACCEWVGKVAIVQIANNLRAARRPKPPSLKEQALKALKVSLTPDGQVTLDITDLNTIRRALEQLND
jgi:hypothetical protein